MTKIELEIILDKIHQTDYLSACIKYIKNLKWQHGRRREKNLILYLQTSDFPGLTDDV